MKTDVQIIAYLCELADGTKNSSAGAGTSVFII
jgi:hypothetical protein